MLLLAIALIIMAYLSGSICAAILVCHLFHLPDPCQEGSKNPGATNVLRLAGKPYAAAVLVFDMVKGLLPVLIVKSLGFSLMFQSCICFFAVLGHVYPVFFNFQGGKGVATALGGLLGLNVFAGLLVVGVWLGVATLTRYSSLASLIAMSLSPLFAAWIVARFDIVPALCLMVLLVFYKHRENISRLWRGKEPKMAKLERHT